MDSENTKTNKTNHSALRKQVVLLFISLAFFCSGQMFNISRQHSEDRVLAATSPAQATLYLEPLANAGTATIPLSLLLNASDQVAFVDAQISFDPTKIKLAQEIILNNTKLTRAIDKTSMALANSTGKISIVTAVEPANRLSPPLGGMSIAVINFIPNTTTPNISTTINITSSQVVHSDTSLYTTTNTGTTIALNTVVPTATPTPIPTPTPTPSFSVTNVKATDITQTTATINWNLSDYGTGQVEYGKTTDYGMLSGLETSFNYNYHAQTLSNLSPNTQYHFRVLSSNKAGLSVSSADNTFKTLSLTVIPTVTPTPTTPPDVTQDSTPPTISIQSCFWRFCNKIQNGYVVRQWGSDTLKVTATDSSGIFSINIFFDQIKVADCRDTTTCSFTLPSTLAKGNHQLQIIATDDSVRANQASIIYTIVKK